jgi:hypothetical protein
MFPWNSTLSRGIGTSQYESSSCDATREATHRGEIPRLTTPASRRGPNRGSHPPGSPGAVSAPIAAPEARRRPAGPLRCWVLALLETRRLHGFEKYWRDAPSRAFLAPGPSLRPRPRHGPGSRTERLRLRPPPLRHLAASATRSHDAPPPELGREAMLGRLGTSRRLMGRGLPPLGRSRPLGLLLRLLHHYARPDPARRQRRERHPAFHHPVPPATSTTATSPKLLSPTVRRAASTRPSAPRSATPSRARNLTSRATPGRNQPPSARLLASLAGVPREPLA